MAFDRIEATAIKRKETKMSKTAAARGKVATNQKKYVKSVNGKAGGEQQQQ